MGKSSKSNECHRLVNNKIMKVWKLMILLTEKRAAKGFLLGTNPLWKLALLPRKGILEEMIRKMGKKLKEEVKLLPPVDECPTPYLCSS